MEETPQHFQNTPYSQALEQTQQRHQFVQKILNSLDSKGIAIELIRGIEQKFGLWAIVISTEDLKHVMEEQLGVQWFINRGYTQENGEELEEVPEITQEHIEELALDIHPWRDIEEDVYPTIQAYLSDTIESLFPDKGD
ncbi:MAG: hypothetical protein EKK63_10990 [Acinetobacter sp.]|uniref:hypothetical protein n=1 Tax=Acinetobacter sp. TaxID=472 RepID=UPI000FA06A47|nr:hypothetical protein [Acinetobacter sp.]RUP38892.1 MAG: hypothetical protein EKK63_10990 [Acinetobacter sp.]